MTQTIKNGSYGGTISEQSDGLFRVFFLYNMDNPTHFHSNGDIWDMKLYKSAKTAAKKIKAFIAQQTQS